MQHFWSVAAFVTVLDRNARVVAAIKGTLESLAAEAVRSGVRRATNAHWNDVCTALSSMGPRWIIRTVIIALAGGVGGGCYWTAHAHGGGPTSPDVARASEPQWFGARVEEQLEQIKRRVWQDVAKGRLGAVAIDEFEQRRRQIKQQLSDANIDGTIDDLERRQIRQSVDSVSVATTPPGYDGGPGGHGSGRARWNWERHQ